MFQLVEGRTYFTLGGRLRMRPTEATYWDGSYVSLWRNSERGREAFFDARVVTPDSHIAWVQSKPPNDLVWMAELNNARTVGMAGIIVDVAARTGEAGRFFIDNARRGQGLGLELHELVLAFGFGVLRLNSMWLDVRKGNLSGIKCCQRAGWREVGVDLEGHVHPGGPVVHMQITEAEWRSVMSAWDRPGAALEIDAYWQSDGELVARRMITSDLARHIVPGDVLEVGCGSGLIYEALRDAGLLEGRVYRGCDPSREMLKIARRRYPGVEFSTMDSWQEPTANVLSIHVLQHLADYRPALSELLRAAQKLLYIVSWFTDEPDSIQYDEATGFYNNFLNRKLFEEALGFSEGMMMTWRQLDGPKWSLAVRV